MNVFSLSGQWMCELPDGKRLPVDVPGCFDAYIDEKDIGGMVAHEREFAFCPENGARYFIRFKAVSYYCEIYLNGRFIGRHEGMWDEFIVDTAQALLEGKNLLRVEIAKPGYYAGDRFPLRQVLSGFIPDVLCTFGGLWGDVSLECHETVVSEGHGARGSAGGAFEISLFLVPLCGSKEIWIETTITSPDGATVFEQRESYPATGRVTIRGTVADCRLWSESNPYLYHYRCKIHSGPESEPLLLENTFGFRTISSHGSALLLNGRPLYFRGILHWGFYDRQITPRPDAAQIRREIEGIRAYGFNAVKHCLYIPSEEYLAAADREGVLLWVELPLWLPEKTPELAERIRREYPRMLRMLARHPSVVIISLGCELDDQVDAGILEEMYHLAKRESNALIRDNSGSGECYGGLAVDFADFFDYHFYGELQNMEPLMEAFTPGWRNTKPWLFGEFCDSDTMRDLRQVRQWYGRERLQWESDNPRTNPLNILKPDFYAHLHDRRAEESGLTGVYDRVRELSVNHSLTHRKMTLEMTRAFPEISGYNITVLRDHPLCASGMFDDIGNPKFNAGPFKACNGPIALAPAWDLTRVWINADRIQNRERFNFTGGDIYSLHLLLSNYGERDIERPDIEWALWDGERTICSGGGSGGYYPSGCVEEIHYIRFALPVVPAPKTYVLKARALFDGTCVENEWPVFVYPESSGISRRVGLYDPACLFVSVDILYETVEFDGSLNTMPDIVLASHLSDGLLRFVSEGGRVFLAQRGKGVLPSVPVAFWREGMIYRDYPSFWNQLQYEHYADDLRFFSLATDTAFDTTKFQAMGFSECRPMVRRYDCRQWLASDYMCEMRYGKGRILATTLRLEGGMGKQPMFVNNNCLGRWILHKSIQDLAAE